MQFRLNRRITAVVAAAVLGVSMAGGAYAYWTAGGTGSGSLQQVTTTRPMTVTQYMATGLTPGGPAVELTGNVLNPNTFAVHVTSLKATITGVYPYSSGVGSADATDTSKPACTVDDFTLIDAGVVIGDVPATVGATSGTAPFSGITIALKNTGANQDNCKSASALIAYKVN